jgi:hypothetical protein
MTRLLIRAGVALLGMVIMLAWWTYGPHKHTTVASSSHIPAKVADGGQKLEIEINTSCPARMRVSFDQLGKPAGEQQLLQSWEDVPAGERSWTVDVPGGVGGYIELEATNPGVGAQLSMRIRMNGELVDEQSDKLEKALEPNTAFFVQDHFDDYSKAARRDQQ